MYWEETFNRLEQAYENAFDETMIVKEDEREEKKMLEWIENYMETFDCDWDTAAREWHALNDSDYDPEDWE